MILIKYLVLKSKDYRERRVSPVVMASGYTKFDILQVKREIRNMISTFHQIMGI